MPAEAGVFVVHVFGNQATPDMMTYHLSWAQQKEWHFKFDHALHELLFQTRFKLVWFIQDCRQQHFDFSQTETGECVRGWG